MNYEREFQRLARKCAEQADRAFMRELTGAMCRSQKQPEAKPRAERCPLCNEPLEPLTELWGSALCERCHLLAVLRGET